MPDKHLHIISFSIPFPANYGGVIDVYYKLKALHKAGIKIHLHCFKYDRETAPELEKYCESVNYYQRNTGIASQLSLIPYIVNSRQSTTLLAALMSDNHPILFEGLHSCYYLNNKHLQNRNRIYRESNIEHHYYYNLAKAEKNVIRKLYFLLESARLFFYQKNLRYADKMLVVSQTDRDYLTNAFEGKSIVYLPSFHGNESVDIELETNSFALYHGNLSVAENVQAALYLIKEVFNNIPQKLVIAGLNPDLEIIQEVKKHSNIELVANPSQDAMQKLVSEAQINILITFQPTGLKLKLLNTLYRGKHVIVNTHMLSGTGLEKLCIIKDSVSEMQQAIAEYMQTDFDTRKVAQRKEILYNRYSDESNANALIREVFGNNKKSEATAKPS